MTDTPRLAIGLLTWNGAATLPACLESLAHQTHTDWELLVIDNASGDASREIVAGWCATHLPPARWQYVRHRVNRGYAAGMNAIAVRTTAPYLLALNQDVALHPRFCAALLERMEEEATLGALCGRIYQSRGLAVDAPGLLVANDPLAWGRGRDLDSTGHLLYRDRIVMNRRHACRDEGFDLTTEHIFGCPGSAAVYRRSALAAIRRPNGELWDSRFFAYLEDVDLDYRMQLAGWECGYEPAAVALHQPHGSGGRATFAIRLRAHMNRYRILAQHETLASLAPDLGPILMQEAYQFGRTTLTNPFLHLSVFPFLWQALRGAYRNRHGGATLDRSHLETTPRWRLKNRPESGDK